MTANTDTIVPIATQSTPYFDDFDETKDFLRILVRPGRAIQGRELTQMQTILQKQIQRFGAGIFENGSMVTGGQITYQACRDEIRYLNLATTYANVSITSANFASQQIISANNSNVVYPKAFVLATAEQNSTEPPTLVVKYTTGVTFPANTTVQALNQNIFANIVATGNSSVASIGTGVYFFNGFFLRVVPQTIILDKYDNTPSCRVGLQFDDSIVTEDQDTSLLDPAQGASNFQAPGAARYKGTLTLSSRALSSTDDSKFIELLRIENGIITKKVEYPLYSDIEKTLARRTFDQSGDFTVRPFLASLHSHIPEPLSGSGTITAGTNSVAGSNTFFRNEITVNSTLFINNQSSLVNAVTSNILLTMANNLTYGATNANMLIQNPDKFTLQLSPAKAYIRGHEFATVAPTNLGVRRGRSFANVASYDSSNPLGNYLFTSNTHGIPDISIMEQFDIHVVPAGSLNFTSASSYGNTKIGTARVRAQEYSSAANTSNGLTHVYKTYLFDVALANSTYTLNNAMSLATFGAAANTSFNKRMDIDAASKSNNNLWGNTIFTDTDFNCLVYPFPQSTLVPSSITNINYEYMKVSSNVAFTNGVATITVSSPECFVGSGALSDTQKLGHYILTVKNSTGMPAQFANGDIIPMTSTLGRSITVSPITTAVFNTAIGNNFVADVVYSITISGTPPTARVKTLVTSNTTNIAVTGNSFITSTNTTVYLANGQVQITSNNNIVKTAGVSQNVYVCDISSLDAVFDFLGNNITQANLASATNVTSRYLLDNGQRDNYYDQGSIKLKPGYAAPAGPLLVCISYFSHSGTSGFLDIDSYPSVTTNAGYASVPNYTSPTTGRVYALRDCLDWRPVKTNATDLSASTTPFVSPRILEPGAFFTSSFSYYLSRVDKIALSQDMKFKVIPGVSSLVPVPPVEDQNDMLLYTLQIPAFTANASDVNVIYNENKRYTMKDIGSLEKRIENLEYYTSLNLLEKSAESLTITDSNGLSRFKNGIIVDNFTGHSVGDVNQFDYQCSMDFKNGQLRPMFASNNAVFNVNSGASTNFKNEGGQITLNYTVSDYLKQNSATGYTAVNLFNYVPFIGNLKLFPDTDTWYDITQRPQIVMDFTGSADAWAALVNGYNASGAGTQYSDWTTNWSGDSKSLQISGAGMATGSVNGKDVTGFVTSTVDTTTYNQVRTVTTQTIVPQTITQSIGNFVVDMSLLPYIRANHISVFGTGVKSSTVFYPFFDNKNVLAYWENAMLLKVSLPTTGYFFANTHETVTSNTGGIGLLGSTVRPASQVANTSYPYLWVTMASGTWNANTVITGSSSGATAQITNVYRFSDLIGGTDLNANGYNFCLNTSATFANTDLVGHPIMLTDGPGSGQIRTIATYNSVSKIGTVTIPFGTIPVQAQTTYNLGFPISTPFGTISGSFRVPNDSNLKFFTGQKSLRLTTSLNNNANDVASFADGTYFAQGLLETKQETSISTRVPQIQTTTSQQNQTYSSSVVTSTIVASTDPSLGGTMIAPGLYAQPVPPQDITGNATVPIPGGQLTITTGQTYAIPSPTDSPVPVLWYDNGFNTTMPQWKPSA